VVPEGDTVWLHAKRLNETLGGQTLTGSDFRLPAYATTDLRGSVVREVVSRGKHLLMRLRTEDRGDWTFRSHLRMDGTWRSARGRWRSCSSTATSRASDSSSCDSTTSIGRCWDARTIL
jgi:endonuclease-8